MHGNTTDPVPKSARDYKMVVVGHRGVGKSALVVRFLTNRFISEYQENSEMTCNGVVEVDGEKLHLKIQDTSEKGIRIPTVDHHFRWADAIMLVYSITDKMSYQRLRYAATRLREKVMEHETLDDKNPTMVVVGNKGDLGHMRQVQTQEGLRLADDLGCEFYETSASEGWSRHFKHAAMKHAKPGRRNGVGDTQRPTTLWTNNEYKNPHSRRKSDPSIVLNTIFGLKVPTIRSPENDLNNNDSKKSPRMSSPSIPRISISPSDEVMEETRTQSRGKKLMQKLSPRFSRKFSGTKQSQSKMSSIGAGLAKMNATGLVAGAMGRDRSNTLPKTNHERTSLTTSASHTLPSHIRSSQRETLGVVKKLTGTTLDCSSSNSSSSESLVTGKENDVCPTFFLRPETPVSDLGISSSEDEFSPVSESATVNGKLAVRKQPAGPIRRSRSICRDLNLEGLMDNRQCNSDSDSSKQKLLPGHLVRRGRSETRADCREFNTNGNSNSISNGTNENEILREKKFNSSEPFKHLCREARSARRMRDRKTPSKLLRDGIRKIKTSFSTEQAHQNNYESHFKNPHFHVTAGVH